MELSLVILILIALIAVTFMGATAWKKGSDRTMAILMIRNAQMGMRTHVQIEGIETPTDLNMPENIFGQNKFVSNGIDFATGLPKPVGALPDHPNSNQSFDFVAGDGDIIPPLGELYICTGGGGGVSDFTYNPIPSVYEQW